MPFAFFDRIVEPVDMKGNRSMDECVVSMYCLFMKKEGVEVGVWGGRRTMGVIENLAS